MNPISVAVVSLFVVASLGGCGGARPHSSEALGEPSLDQMSLAQPAGKVSVPVDVRYQLADTLIQDQPTTLWLAFIPRVAGENLRVEFPASDSLTIESGDTTSVQQKAEVAGVYRRTLVVTPRAGGASEVRVLVSMDVEGGRYFGVFSIPLVAVTE